MEGEVLLEPNGEGVQGDMKVITTNRYRRKIKGIELLNKFATMKIFDVT